MSFTYYATSNRGLSRSHNEDCYLCNPEHKLFLVADGIGGHTSGEIASKMAINDIEEFVVRSRTEDITWPIPYRRELSLEQNRLLAAATVANQKIRGLVSQNPSMKGMGTTLVGFIIEGNLLAVINIGDSRLYRIRDDSIEQITRDHTVAGIMERMGLLTKEEASCNPQKHVLTSALGIEPLKNLRVDLFPAEICTKDLFLLCSDGLYDMLGDEEIVETIQSFKDKSLERACHALIERANLAGGKDNITIILLSFN
ncbi:MAG: serine/threonine-protein phosphatase [Deltaproteobacteria bacterium]|nr:serine/threonine-protein phosphatase [Deltaproteobacteria bacterium]MBW2076298.1 serine/threonine-protein phosphatase [Deltaproteobacteria bacterium]